MTLKKVKKRFVAGAKCPQCGELDSILLFLEHGIETIECTDCDYREQQADNNIKKSTQAEMIGLFKPE